MVSTFSHSSFSPFRPFAPTALFFFWWFSGGVIFWGGGFSACSVTGPDIVNRAYLVFLPFPGGAKNLYELPFPLLFFPPPFNFLCSSWFQPFQQRWLAFGFDRFFFLFWTTFESFDCNCVTSQIFFSRLFFPCSASWTVFFGFPFFVLPLLNISPN